MSVEGWIRRFAKRGLLLHVRLQQDGRWFVIIEPADPKLQDQRLRRLAGVAFHLFRDEAIRAAVLDYEARLENQRREQVVLALAGAA